MERCYVGLDVATKTTAVCVLSEVGEIVFEGTVDTEPRAIAATLKPWRRSLAKVGHETGALAPWLHKELQRAGLPIVCLEALHMRAALAAQRNKTDRNDAFGIAQLLRAGWVKTAHVKSDQAHRMRLLLAHRRALKRKAVDLENALRQTLKAFGIRLHAVGRTGFRAAIEEVAGDDPLIMGLADAMLRARDALLGEFNALHALVDRLARHDPVG
jgi:transposase